MRSLRRCATGIVFAAIACRGAAAPPSQDGDLPSGCPAPVDAGELTTAAVANLGSVDLNWEDGAPVLITSSSGGILVVARHATHVIDSSGTVQRQPYVASEPTDIAVLAAASGAGTIGVVTAEAVGMDVMYSFCILDSSGVYDSTRCHSLANGSPYLPHVSYAGGSFYAYVSVAGVVRRWSFTDSGASGGSVDLWTSNSPVLAAHAFPSGIELIVSFGNDPMPPHCSTLFAHRVAGDEISTEMILRSSMKLEGGGAISATKGGGHLAVLFDSACVGMSCADAGAAQTILVTYDGDASTHAVLASPAYQTAVVFTDELATGILLSTDSDVLFSRVAAGQQEFAFTPVAQYTEGALLGARAAASVNGTYYVAYEHVSSGGPRYTLLSFRP